MLQIRNQNKIYNKIKIAFIALTLALLCKNINSQLLEFLVEPDKPNGSIGSDRPRRNFQILESNDCKKKSNYYDRNADCCLKKPQPRWCPRMSVSSIKNELSKLNRTSYARSFVNKKISLYRSKSQSLNHISFSRSDRSIQSRALTYRNFWWPWFCDRDPWCCYWCYIMWVWKYRYDNYQGQYICIWWRCR